MAVTHLTPVVAVMVGETTPTTMDTRTIRQIQTILYVVNDDGVYRSDDFGMSFYSVGAGMQTGQFYNGFSCSATDFTLRLGSARTISRVTDIWDLILGSQ